METTNTMDVIVRKATIALSGDESIDSYCQKVSQAGVAHAKMKLNFTKDGSNGAWPVEIYGDKMIVAAYKGDSKTKYYAFKYTRDKNGAFSFDNLTEVERKTSYQPVSPLATVNKSIQSSDAPKTFGDWTEIAISKNFWGGVL